MKSLLLCLLPLAALAIEAREPPMSGLPSTTITVPSSLTETVALDSPPPLNQ